MGNQAAQRLLRDGVIQAKLTVNQPGDRFEQEADRVAERVMRMPDSTAGTLPNIQRVCSKCEEELHRTMGPGIKTVGESFKHPTNGGRPLPDSERRFFEPRFGRDLSKVRIHTDEEASVAARSVNALAYTMGNDVVFGNGQYRPGTEDGRKLLAHELTHVIQQRAAGTPSVQRLGDPKQKPAGLPCPIPTGSPVFVNVDVLFSLESSTLTSTAIADIASFIGRWKAAGANKAVRVDGYASTDGPQPLNWTLACDRAKRVEKELKTPSSQTTGIPASYMKVFAHGTTNEFSNALEPNRRAVISADIPGPAETGCRACPFYCGYDKGKDLLKYNCSGLAFRTYLWHDLDETKNALALGSRVSCGTPCDKVGMIKFWLWEYDARREDSSGRVINPFPHDFHIVGGPTGGVRVPQDSDEFYSKNGHRNVHGPGTAPSFKPPAKEQETWDEPSETLRFDQNGDPLYFVRFNFKESCHCFPCPKNLQDAKW
jgi:outer membrane protein OmpA-like peptidoglycan-associated protein